MKKEKTQKIELIKNIRKKSVVIIVIKLLLYIILAYNIFFLINTTITKKSYINLFGYDLFIIDNKLMEDELNKNDLVISKKISQEELKTNDIIISKVDDSIRINRIINKYNVNGNVKYITKFDKNFQPDVEELSIEDIIGKKVNSYRGIGLLFKIGQSRITTVIVIIILFLNYKHLQELDRKREKKKNSSNETAPFGKNLE